MSLQSSLQFPTRLPVPHINEREDTVEGGHEDVGRGEVQQEVVCNAPHPLVSCIGGFVMMASGIELPYCFRTAQLYNRWCIFSLSVTNIFVSFSLFLMDPGSSFMGPKQCSSFMWVVSWGFGWAVMEDL